ncbi:MAG: hypothetical protein ACK41E_02960 [Deinococcales bacterium]
MVEVINATKKRVINLIGITDFVVRQCLIMKMLPIFVSSLLLGFVLAQEFTGVLGTWVARAVNRTVTLKLEESNGVLIGILEGMGETLRLNGKRDGMKAEGTTSSPSGEAYFKLEVKGDTLTLTLANFNEQNQPDFARGVTIQLDRDFGPKAQDAFQIAGFNTPPADPLVGSWKNATILLTLKGLGNNKYSGNIEINRQKATLGASGNSSALKGSFKLGKVQKYFSAKLEKDTLRFILDGRTQVLLRVR